MDILHPSPQVWIAELGTRDNCCDNLTTLRGQKKVGCHVNEKYCIETLFDHKRPNIFIILVCHKGSLCRWSLCHSVALSLVALSQRVAQSLVATLNCRNEQHWRHPLMQISGWVFTHYIGTQVKIRP